MKNPVLEGLKLVIISALQSQYGYAGVAENDEMVIINSGKRTDIKITIEEKPTGE